ncbi:hypothetical protein, partial [Mycobacterium deserti]
MNAAITVTRHNDRIHTNATLNEITGAGDLTLMSNKHPCTREKPIHLRLEYLRIGEDLDRYQIL